MSDFPHIFTFYSFKGGVGRSMALLNTAYTLASWGRHVLVVDLDLEAPGVSSFLERHQELDPLPSGRHPMDVLSLLSQVIQNAKDGASAQQIAATLPPLQQYIRHVSAAKLENLKPKLGKVGRLDVLGADLGRNWCERLATLGITGMPQDQLAVASEAVRLCFKRHRFPFRPLGLEDFEPDELIAYDYVLVDSRTGVTEIGGLCVGPLADRLVVFCGLNDQNISGTAMFLREIGLELQPRDTRSARWDDEDSPEHPGLSTLGPKPTLLVATPVPSGELTAKQDRLRAFQSALGARPVLLSYHPQMALMETNFVRDWPHEYLALEYESLSTQITQAVQDDAQWLSHKVQLSIESKPLDSKLLQSALRASSQSTDVGRTLLTHVSDRIHSEKKQAKGLLRNVCATLAKIPLYRNKALNNWGVSLLNLANQKEGQDAERFFLAAVAKYVEALQDKPDNCDALCNWGGALLVWAERKRGAEADELFQSAGEKFAAVLRIKPDMVLALHHWGVSLYNWALRKDAEQANQLLDSAGEKFAEALRIMPGAQDILNNWAASLLLRASHSAGDVANFYLEQAENKLKIASEVAPDEKYLLYNYACLHALRGNAKGTVEKLSRWRLAEGSPSRKKLEDDRSFDRIREEPEFQAFLRTLSD